MSRYSDLSLFALNENILSLEEDLKTGDMNNYEHSLGYIVLHLGREYMKGVMDKNTSNESVNMDLTEPTPIPSYFCSLTQLKKFSGISLFTLNQHVIKKNFRNNKEMCIGGRNCQGKIKWYVNPRRLLKSLASKNRGKITSNRALFALDKMRDIKFIQKEKESIRLENRLNGVKS